MPSFLVGKIKVNITFHSRLTYDKSGRMVSEKTMTTTYFNAATRKAATKDEIRAAGIKNIQKRNVKLTPENASYLMDRAQRVARGELKEKNFANLIGSKTYGLPTEQQLAQFRDALNAMFKSTNPTEAEWQKWVTMISKLSPQECQEFYIRHQSTLKPGFTGYSSNWTSVGNEPMQTYDPLRDGDVNAWKNREAASTRRALLDALQQFLKSKGQMKIDEF